MIDNIYKKLGFLSGSQNLFAFILFVCLSIYALNANPFAGETVAPFDRLLEISGWASVQSGVKALHAERSDILDSQLPTWITLKDQIRRGESPFWYPNGAGGQPVSLELCNPMFYLFVLIKDNALAYYMVGLVKLVISGFGTYLLLRVLFGWLPSIWGGIVFMLCGFNAAWFFWEQVTTAMWIPWLLWSSVMYLKTEKTKWLPAITLTALLIIFGGFPAVAAFGFYSFSLLIVVWNLHRAFSGNWRHPFKEKYKVKISIKMTALPLLAVCIAFVMAATALIPFRDAMSGINLGYRTSRGIPLSIDDLSLFFAYGDPPPVERTAYIGILACIFSFFGIFRIFRRNDRPLRLFIFFNVLLVIVTVSIAFGLLPHQLIEALPVFKNNPAWGRLLVVTLLALAVLSAAGLDLISEKINSLAGQRLTLAPRNVRLIVVLVLIGITAVQFHDQKNLFNRFNAVVPSAWFYPPTPSLGYVKDNLKPLQSVIADISFFFAGTLGAYGIPEWYAHSFRTDREKEVLRELVHDPFASPTSMMINGDRIQFDSPLMDKLGIKYLLVNKGVLESKQLFTSQGLETDLAPPLPGNSWRQHIYLPEDMVVEAFGFLFATGGKASAPANVRLSLYNDRYQKLAFEPELAKTEIRDNQWGYIQFPGKLPLKKGGYILILSLADYAGDDKLSAWATKNQGNFGSFLEVNGVKTDFSLKWEIRYYKQNDLSPFFKKWNVTDRESNIYIFENKNVTGGAYFVKNVDGTDDAVDYSGLDVEQPSSDLIKIRYSKEEAGWVVLPMHFDPGWKAYVDNSPVRPDRYIGILPAIPVKGRAEVLFKYEAESFRRGLAVSLIGCAFFAIFLWWSLRKPEKRKE